MWLVARTRANERDVVQQALRLTQIENALAAATIQARRGDYEPARTAASTFYTTLREELDRADSGFAVPSRDTLQALLAERDQMITLLARRDLAVADRLANTYISYRQLAGTLPRQAAPQDGGRCRPRLVPFANIGIPRNESPRTPGDQQLDRCKSQAPML
jgi:hypothetical protein